MTADPSDLRRVLQVFVVAVEYRGPDITTPTAGEARVAVFEHAYDLHTATLAGHPHNSRMRIAFPTRIRGWNTPPEIPRCPDCDIAVTAIVRDLITTALRAALTRLPFT